MNAVGIVLSIIGALALLFSGVLLVKKVRPLAKALALEAYDLKKERKDILIRIGLITLSSILLFIGLGVMNNYNLDVGEYFKIVFGSMIFSSNLAIGYTSFRLHYYQKQLDKKIDRILYICWIISMPIAVFSLFLLIEGYSAHWGYPLYNGISFTQGLVNPSTGKPNIAWYALCIVSGAVLVYFMCDHFAYKKWGKHGLLESTFFVAFPSGIIGARIFYVIGNWNLEFANQPFWKVFAIWEGGLTILGGAVVGIIAGALWFKHVNKNLSVGEAANFIVPTILVAQAIGRWGNFFNCEVHGIEQSVEYWMWLPNFIRSNASYSSTQGFASEGNIFVPLFLIEGIVNLIGFIILEVGGNRLFHRHVRPLDLCFAYISWYGATRTFMEPLRDTSFNMGSNGGWSWYWSIIFIAAGILGIVINHLFRSIYYQKKGLLAPIEDKKRYINHSIIALSVILIVALALFIPGLIMFINNTIPEGTSVITLVPRNIGLILFVCGLGVLSLIALPIYRIIRAGNKI